MDQLPNYFVVLSENLSEETIESLVSLEIAFDLISYTRHSHQLDDIVTVVKDGSGKDISDEALLVYRTAIADALALQGIFLSDPFEENIGSLAQLMRAIAILGTSSLNDILEDEVIEEEENGLVYLASVLSIITETPISEILLYLEDVHPETIATIQRGGELSEVEGKLLSAFRPRFMEELGDDKTGPVANLVRDTGRIGFDLVTIRSVVADDIELLDDNAAAREVRLLLKGSSLPDESLGLQVGDTIDYIFEPTRAVKIAAKVGEL